jgi:hypothetical protein
LCDHEPVVPNRLRAARDPGLDTLFVPLSPGFLVASLLGMTALVIPTITGSLVAARLGMFETEPTPLRGSVRFEHLVVHRSPRDDPGVAERAIV